MTFIPAMLSEILRDPGKLEDPGYVAEPKFDGQRAQIHVEGGRTVAAYSRRRLDLLRHAGFSWLRDVRWGVSQAVLDGELCGETGSDVVGHVLPIQLAFRGGKGIAPSIGALIAYDAWALLVSAVVFGLAYVISAGRLVPSGLVAYALAPVTGLALRRPGVELAVLAALAHRGHIRRARGLGAAMS